MELWELADLCTPWCVHVVATLRVAEHIAAGHCEIADLAAAAGADRDALYRVMRHLAGKGLFVETAPGSFALNDFARQLLNPGARAALDLEGFGGRMAGAWNTLVTAVRTGRPAYRNAFGRDYWDDLDAHPEIAASFDEAMGPGHGICDPDVLPDRAAWASIRQVVDVGGGTGMLLAEVLRAHPQVRGTLVDLPRTVTRAGEIFAAAGVADRVTVSGQSFFDPLPAGADLYLLKSVIPDWPDPEAMAILRRCAEAARPSRGRIVVFTSAGPGEEADPELLMLVLVGGKARTIEELTALARAAGLEPTGIGRQASGRVLFECRPADAA